MILHAGCVARRLGGAWRAVLITGRSGAGKSDLALRLLERGWRLSADDRTVLWRSGDALWARAPETLHGRIEARGLGITPEPAVFAARVALNVDCGAAPDRVPDPDHAVWLEVAVPRVRVAPLEASATAKVERALLAAWAGAFDLGSDGLI